MKALKAVEAQNGSDYVVALLNYVLTIAETGSTEELVDAVKEGLSEHTGERVMTIAEQLIQRGEQRGLEKGILQGIQQGTLEGEKNLLKRQLGRRFGQIFDIYLEKIDHADSSQLLEWGDKVIDAKSLEEIFENYH